jgi:hypothetical protein
MRRLNRRVFLRGLGGACVAAPFLESIAPRGAKAQSATAPRRLIVMFTHYGCVTNRFFPAKSHGPLTAGDLEATTLEPLAPYAGKLLMPRGIRAMNQWSPKMDLGQGNDTHYHVGSFFTCQPLTPNSDSPFSFDSSSRFPPKPVGPSLDHVMARQISPEGKPLLMMVGNRSENPYSAISYSEAQTVFRGLSSSQVYQTLTGLFQPAAPLSPDSYQAASGKSMVDLVRDDLDTLARFDMSRDDQLKLEAWKALLDDTGRLVPAGCGPETAKALGLTPEAFTSSSTGGADRDALSSLVEGTSIDGADVYSNLAVLAALCNANPVIFLKYPPNHVFRGLGLTLESHSLSHRLENASMAGVCVPGVLDMLLKIDDFYARKFARLLEMLNSFDEGAGKLLDNTATVWLQEQSDGAAHNLNNLPIVQAGGAGGYFKTGWAVNVDDGSASLSTGNSEAFCASGTAEMIDGTKLLTGTDPAFANAPINKYFCNLMNALGVKAGPDGFPAEGGAAEVTRFGMYDKTQDFVGGGTNPPTIHDPGEFAALRANA